MTAVICGSCGCGDDLGDGGYEVGYDWDRGMCLECQVMEDFDVDEELAGQIALMADDVPTSEFHTLPPDIQQAIQLIASMR